MRKHILAIAMLLIVVVLSTTAQTRKPTSRLEKQHTSITFVKERLNKTETGLVGILEKPFANEGLNPPLQTIRDLVQLFPDYAFSKLIPPLKNILRDNTADPTSRMLAALALDELHSDSGDLVIKEMAEKSENVGIQTLCKALLNKSSLE